MRRLALGCLLVAGVAAAPALAGVSDRVRAAPPGMNATAAFSAGLWINFTSPPDYRRGCCYDNDGGQWLGPRYAATGQPSLAGDSSIDWGYGPVRAASAQAAVRDHLVHADGREVESGTVAVPHLVGGRNAGSITAFYVITQLSVMAGNARHEGGLAFPLGRGMYARAGWSLLSPCCDSAGPFGTYRVNGVLASTWNRAQVQAAVRGIALDGSLPPARLTTRRSGRRVRGIATDSFGHPVARAAAKLERRSGRRWRAAASTRTSATGAYSLRAQRAGTYRVAIALAASTIRSRAFRVR